MTLSDWVYRAQQFWQALGARPAAEDLVLASSVLSGEQMALFTRMHKSEQVHSLKVFKQLYQQGKETLEPHASDLWVAALLHDVGKSRHPLLLWERVLIVVVKAFFPDQTERWGLSYDSKLTVDEILQKKPHSLRKAFIVAARHADWGAEMAQEAGASPLAVSLIRQHQNPEPVKAVTIEEQLLFYLQTADSRN